MWRTKKQNGYTIVEVMIVLAVTGAMFVSTIALLSDQTQIYRFKAATYNAQQAVQSSINDVQAGYFNVTNVSPPSGCIPQGGGAAFGNTNCMYVGKKITIKTNGKIETTPLWLFDNQTPAATTIPNDFTALRYEVDLPYYIEYSPETTFFVMFNNYTDRSEGGTQSFGIYSDGILGAMPVAGAIVCLKDNNRQAKLIIGANSATSVDLVYENCP